MADNRFNESSFAEWFESRKQQILIIGIPAVVLLIVLIIVLVNVLGKRGGKEPVATPTSTVTQAVTPVPTDKPATPVPTSTPTVAATATPTPEATPTPTVTPEATATPVPTNTPTPTVTKEPEEKVTKLTVAEAKEVLLKYSKETLNIEKDVKSYKIDYNENDPTTLINGSNCYCFTLLENVNGIDRNRGEFYISDDGRSCYVFDSETGAFVPLPQG